MQRYDTVAFTATKTDEGFIQDSPIVGRSGILVYHNADGTERREYRPPEEAFKADSLATLKAKPITIGHKAMVDSQNASAVAPVGTVLSDGRQDGNDIRADIVIYNLDTDARELSCGYRLDLDETPGVTPEGEHYDAIQRNIVYNHLAIVTKGRAGVARLNMDGDQIIEDEPNRKDDNKMAEKTMTKIRLDGGLEYEAAPEVGVYVDKLRADMEQMRKDAEDKAAEAKKEKDTMQAKLDGLTSDLAKAKEDMEKAEKEHKEAFDSAVKARVELLGIANAKKIENADSMTDDEIKIAVIKSVRGDSINLDGKSADYIAAAFDLCKADESKREDAMAKQRQDAQTHVDSKHDAKADSGDVGAAYQALLDAESKAYMKGRE